MATSLAEQAARNWLNAPLDQGWKFVMGTLHELRNGDGAVHRPWREAGQWRTRQLAIERRQITRALPK